ncbi:MAG: hypothetical protein HFE82_00150 [Erysipelotrichaceae bacterium]|nr:hypothetical protein [Erysipelotrichaceae bacterium]
MNRKNIIYFVSILFLLLAILFSNSIQPNTINYEFNANKMSLILLSKLIAPCLLGSFLAISTEHFFVFKLSKLQINKKFYYILNGILILYIFFMLYPILSIYMSYEIPSMLFNYIIFATKNLYLYIIIYFITTLVSIKELKNKQVD